MNSRPGWIANQVINAHRRHSRVWERAVHVERPEIMDGFMRPELANKIHADLERFSKRLGVEGCVLRDIDRLMRQEARSELKVLEVCAGTGWLSNSIFDRYTQCGVQVKSVALDSNADALSLRCLEHGSQVECVVGDALKMDFEDQAFDLVVQVQSLHHFEPDAVVALLAEMSRVAQRVYVFDVRRTPFGWLLMHMFRPMACREFIHDAALSHRRAYSTEELELLAAMAGVDARVESRIGVGMALLG